MTGLQASPVCPLQSECSFLEQAGAVNLFAVCHYGSNIPLKCFLGMAGCADWPSYYASNKLVNWILLQLEDYFSCQDINSQTNRL